jgi:hypothetical protein
MPGLFLIGLPHCSNDPPVARMQQFPAGFRSAPLLMKPSSPRVCSAADGSQEKGKKTHA